MIWYLPLELLPMRYTSMQDDVTRRAFRKAGLSYSIINGEPLTESIDTGAFLDANSTNHFKFSQLQQVAKLFHEHKIQSGDAFYISDLWFPGIEAIKYMAFFNKVPVGVFGILHAGSFTPTDYVNALKYWARPYELSLLKMADGIFLGSEQTRQDIIKTFNPEFPELEKLHVTGLAYDSHLLDKYKVPFEDKDDIILFPHRLDKEKQPELFDKLKSYFPDCEFIKTHEHNFSKPEYYKLLGKSKVLFSASLQENFGYSVLECCSLGVTPVLPINNTCYKYMYPKYVLYRTFEEAIDRIKVALKTPIDLTHISDSYNSSLDRQVQIIKEWMD